MILIAGPESTGKSTLAKRLSLSLGYKWIPEYGRTYLEQHGPGYTYEDIEVMALRHADLVNEVKDNKVILDTFLLNYKIWSIYKYGKVSPRILSLLSQCSFDHILLMSPDMPWEEGPYRENPNDRDVLFDIYVNEFEVLGWPYNIIEGIGEERFEKALRIVSIL